MDMGMMVEGLPPGMQDGQDADLRAQVFRVAGNSLEGLRHSLKENGIHRAGMLEGQRAAGRSGG